MKDKEYLSLGGLFIALHLVFVLLSKFVPGSSLLLVIFLPLLSTIYTLKFNKDKVVMFVSATLFLCLIFEPVSTLIYIIPSLMCGVSYGVLRKKSMKELSLVYTSSLAHSISLLISFLFISILFKEVDFFVIFKSFISKEGSSFYALIYLTLMLLGVVESFILHMICNSELLKLGYQESEKEKETPLWMVVSLIAFTLIYFSLSFINPIYTIYVIPFVICFSIPIVIEFINRNNAKWIYILVALFALIALFLLGVIDGVYYPILFVFVVIPILLEKIVRVLYTFSLNSSNKKKNIIE